MRLSEWKANGKYTDINGHRIFYAEAGSGEVLLLLHAYPTASWGWHRMWPALSERFHVIAPDLLGSGLSDKPRGGPYSVVYLADLVGDLLAKLGVDKVHILAHAYGSSVAQELLARQTGEQDIEIQSLCFVNGGIFPEVAKTTMMQKLLLTPVGSLLAQNFPSPYGMFQKNFAATFGPHTKPSAVEMQEFWDLLTYNEGHRRVPEVIQYLNERKQQRERWVGAMMDTKIPVGLINGTSDELIGEATNRRWQELLPHAPLIVLDGELGHYPPLEDAEAVLSAYFSFWEQLSH